MPKYLENPQIIERTWIAVLLVLVLFLSPMTEFWAALDAPWFGPYIVWAIAIGLSWFLQRYISKNSPK